MSKFTLKGYGAKLTPTNDGEPFTVTILSSHIPRIGETVVHKGRHHNVHDVEHTVHPDGGLTVVVDVGWAREDLT